MSADIDVLLHFQGGEEEEEEEEGIRRSISVEDGNGELRQGGGAAKRRRTTIKPISKACNECARRKARCPGGQPCASCVKSGANCEYSPAQRRGPKAKKRSEEASSISNGKNNSNGVNGQRLSPQEQQQQSGEERGLNLLAELSRVSDGPGGSSSSTLNTLNGTGNVSNHGFGDGSMQNQQHSTTRNGVARALEGTSSSSGNLTISPSHSLLSLPPMQLNSACHPGNTTTGGGYTLHQQQHNHTQEQSNLSNKNSGNNVSSANATVHTAFPSSLFPPESSDGQFAGISNPTRTSTSNSSRLLEGSHATNNGSTSSTANNLAGMKHPTMSSMMNDFVNGFVPTTRPQYINSSQHQQHQHYTSANSASSSVTLPNSQLFNLPPFNLDSANQHHPFANADGSLSSIAATPNDGSSHSGTTLPTHYSHHQHQQMKSSQSNLPHSGSSHALPVPVPSGVSAPLPPPISSDLAGEEDSSAAFAQSFYKAEGPGLGHFQTVLSREFNVRDGASPSGASGTTTATSSHAYAHYAAAGGTASSSAGGGTHSHFMGGSMGGVNGDPSSVPSDVGFSPAGSDVPLPPHMEKDLVALADLPSTQQQLFGVYWCFVHPQWPIVYRPTFGYEEAKEIPALYNAMLAIICRPDVSRQLQHVPGTLKKLPLASRLGEIYTKRAIGHLNLMEMASSLHKVQALFMLALFDIGQGNTSRGWMFCGMATRMAYDLSLHQPSKTYRHGPATPIVQQEQRRTIWCCYALDMSMSIFLGRPSMMKYSEIETPLPSHWESDEFSYWAEDAKAVIPDRLDAFVGVQARPVSTLVAYVKLCHILERTMGSVYKPKGGMARASSSAAEELNNALDGWLDEHAELFTRAESPGQCTTNIYHVLLWYHTTRLILNRPFIPNNQLINSSKGEKSAYAFCTEAADEIVSLSASLDETHGIFRVSYNVMFTIFQAGVMHCLISSTARDPLITAKANESFKQCDSWLDSMTRSYKCTAQYRHVLVAMERLSRRELRDPIQVTEILASRGGSRQPTPAYSDPSGENGLLPGDYNENPLSMLHYSFWDMPLHFPLQNNEMDSWMSWEQDYGSLLIEGINS